MNYAEYKALAKQELPEIPVDILTTAGNLSPPELLTFIAVQLFTLNISDSPLAVETRRQIQHKSVHGITDFN